MKCFVRKYNKVYIDLDGTIAGSSEWKSFCWNTKNLFQTQLHFQIPKNCPEWYLLTSRPIIDKPIIYWFIKKYKIYPKKIITSPTLFYKFKDKEEVARWKSDVLCKILLSECPFLDKLIYIDNDVELRNNMLYVPNLITCSSDSFLKILSELNYVGE